MHDLVGGRAAWTVLGLPTEGEVGDRRRIRDIVRPAASVGITATVADAREAAQASGHAHAPIAVLGVDNVLIGSLDPVGLRLPPKTAVEQAMVRAPGTIRPDVRVDEALQQLRGDGLAYPFVTTARGEIVGLLFSDDHV